MARHCKDSQRAVRGFGDQRSPVLPCPLTHESRDGHQGNRQETRGLFGAEEQGVSCVGDGCGSGTVWVLHTLCSPGKSNLLGSLSFISNKFSLKYHSENIVRFWVTKPIFFLNIPISISKCMKIQYRYLQRSQQIQLIKNGSALTKG